MPLRRIAHYMDRQFLPALPLDVYRHTRINGVEAA